MSTARAQRKRLFVATVATALTYVAAACGPAGDSGPRFSAEEHAAYAAAQSDLTAAITDLRSLDLDASDLSGPEIGQTAYRAYSALDDMIKARRGDANFDAAADALKFKAGALSAQAVRTLRPEDMSANISDFLAVFDDFETQHLSSAAG